MLFGEHHHTLFRKVVGPFAIHRVVTHPRHTAVIVGCGKQPLHFVEMRLPLRAGNRRHVGDGSPAIDARHQQLGEHSQPQHVDAHRGFGRHGARHASDVQQHVYFADDCLGSSLN